MSGSMKLSAASNEASGHAEGPLDQEPVPERPEQPERDPEPDDPGDPGRQDPVELPVGPAPDQAEQPEQAPEDEKDRDADQRDGQGNEVSTGFEPGDRPGRVLPAGGPARQSAAVPSARPAQQRPVPTCQAGRPRQAEEPPEPIEEPADLVGDGGDPAGQQALHQGGSRGSSEGVSAPEGEAASRKPIG